jgi:DNA-binding NarL/FixJ family response regulator
MGQAYSSPMSGDNKMNSESGHKPPAGGLSVVLVEDSILMRAHVASALGAIKGLAPLQQAVDVPAGLRLLQTVKADVLILDIGLPGQSGMDLLKIARGRDPNIVIIMLTIHDHPMLRKNAFELGANHFFNKFHEFDRVAEVCSQLAERRVSQAGP